MSLEFGSERACAPPALSATRTHTYLVGSGASCSPLSLIHISEPTRPEPISYAVFCLKKKNADRVMMPMTATDTLYATPFPKTGPPGGPGSRELGFARTDALWNKLACPREPTGSLSEAICGALWCGRRRRPLTIEHPP